MSLHNFASANRSAFPPGRCNAPYNYGWSVFVLQFIEQADLHDRFDKNANFYDPVNQPIVQTPLPFFECPSDPGGQQVFEMRNAPPGNLPFTPPVQGAASDYFACYGVWDPAYGDADRRDGVFQNNKVRPLAAILDGTTNTILVFEQAGRPAQWCNRRLVPGYNQANGSWWGAWAAFNGAQIQAYDDSCTQSIGTCAINCNNGRGVYAFHPGGAHVLMADGAVRFLRNETPPEVLYALATRASGETVSNSEF